MNFKVHACLAANMNILRRKLSTTCITSQTVRYDVTAVGGISEEAADE